MATHGITKIHLQPFWDEEYKQLEYIQEKLNNRPRKIIGFKTPKEIMNFELKNVA